MRFTALSLLLTVQISLWCILGAMVHGWQILCYPLAWVGIAGFFYALNTWHDRRHARQATQGIQAVSAPHLQTRDHRHGHPEHVTLQAEEAIA